MIRVLVIYSIICWVIHNEALAQENPSGGVPAVQKPYSFEIDQKAEDDLIQVTREKILRTCTINELLKQVEASDIDLKLDAIGKLAYVANENGRKVIEKIMLEDESAIVRSKCAKALGTLQSRYSKEALSKAIEDVDRKVKINAAYALARIGEKSMSFKVYSSIYEEGNQIPYYSCHQGLLHIGTTAVRQYLVNDLSNSDPFVAIDAAIILAQLGYYSDAFPLLEGFINYGDKNIRMAALRGLAYIGDERSLDLINSKIIDPEDLVKNRARTILSNYKVNKSN